MAHFEISVTQSYGGFLPSHESLFGPPSREPDTPYISTTTEASRYECAASRVGGTTPGPFPEGLTYAAHRKGIDWFDVTWAHQPELPLNCYLGWRGMTWIVLAVGWFTAGLILAFGPDLFAKATETIDFFANY